MKTIRVTGTGRVTAAPDTIEIPISFSTVSKKYAETVRKDSQKAEEIAALMEEAGFRKEDLKMRDYQVDTYYESYRDRDGNYKSKFEGYKCSRSFSLQFPKDMKLLAKAVGALGQCLNHPEFSIRFMIKNTDDAVSAMLENAAISAAAKAAVLCRASGVELGELQSIDYSWDRINVYSNTRLRKNCLEDMSPDYITSDGLDFEPENIEISENVTFIWEVK